MVVNFCFSYAALPLFVAAVYWKNAASESSSMQDHCFFLHCFVRICTGYGLINEKT